MKEGGEIKSPVPVPEAAFSSKQLQSHWAQDLSLLVLCAARNMWDLSMQHFNQSLALCRDSLVSGKLVVSLYLV